MISKTGMNPPKKNAFTLIELLVALVIFSAVSVGLCAFTATSMRLVGRNLATNHTHQTMRISGQQLLYDLHQAACAFRLISFDGTNYTDLTPTATTDVDAFTQQYASTRANGVRFRVQAGGPYPLTANTTAASTSLQFDFGVGGQLPYVPQVGDKVAVPLLSRDFDITAVTTVPTPGNTTGVITISDPAGLGFAVDTTTSGNLTTGYFYREVAYTVYNNQLRFHANYNGLTKGNWRLIRNKITSPQPFALLFPTNGTASDGLNLRLSLEYYDTDYSARKFTSGTVTLQATVPIRDRPPPISSTNAS